MATSRFFYKNSPVSAVPGKKVYLLVQAIKEWRIQVASYDFHEHFQKLLLLMQHIHPMFPTS
jgi:hypothetical protein